jgi:hypothetical protein
LLLRSSRVKLTVLKILEFQSTNTFDENYLQKKKFFFFTTLHF